MSSRPDTRWVTDALWEAGPALEQVLGVHVRPKVEGRRGPLRQEQVPGALRARLHPRRALGHLVGLVPLGSEGKRWLALKAVHGRPLDDLPVVEGVGEESQVIADGLPTLVPNLVLRSLYGRWEGDWRRAAAHEEGWAVLEGLHRTLGGDATVLGRVREAVSGGPLREVGVREASASAARHDWAPLAADVLGATPFAAFLRLAAARWQDGIATVDEGALGAFAEAAWVLAGQEPLLPTASAVEPCRAVLRSLRRALGDEAGYQRSTVWLGAITGAEGKGKGPTWLAAARLRDAFPDAVHDDPLASAALVMLEQGPPPSSTLGLDPPGYDGAAHREAAWALADRGDAVGAIAAMRTALFVQRNARAPDEVLGGVPQALQDEALRLYERVGAEAHLALWPRG